MLHDVLRRLVPVRPDEVAAALWSFVFFGLVLAGYYVLRPLRETMATAVGGADSLAWLFTATFATMLVAAPLFSLLVSRVARQRIVPLLYHFFAANLLAFFAVLAAGVPLASVANVYFVWVSVYNLFVVSAAWSLMADVFSSEQAKRLFGFVAAGASAGAILGPVLTSLLVERIGVPYLVLVSAILLEAAVACALLVRRSATSRAADPAEPGPDPDETVPGEPIARGMLSGLRRVVRSPYLLAIALQVVLFAGTSTFLYMEQVRYVADAGLAPEGRTALFARMDLAINVLNVATQVFVTGRVLSRLGLAVGLATLPIVTLLGFSILALVPVLGVVIVFQVLRRAGHFAIDRPSREILFTVLPPAEKYASKSFIDTVVYRGADALSAWVPAALRDRGAPAIALSLVALPVSACWLVLNLALARRQRRMEEGQASSGAGALANPALATP